MKRIIIIVLSGLMVLTVLCLHIQSDNKAWIKEGLKRANYITVYRNPDRRPFKVKIASGVKASPNIFMPVGDFDTAHERNMREGEQSAGEIGLQPSMILEQDHNYSR